MTTRGEGRSPAEKTSRVIVPADVRRAEREAREREERDWANRSGPVVVKKPRSNGR